MGSHSSLYLPGFVWSSWSFVVVFGFVFSCRPRCSLSSSSSFVVVVVVVVVVVMVVVVVVVVVVVMVGSIVERPHPFGKGRGGCAVSSLVRELIRIF